MQLIGEDPRKAINEFSREFERDFLQLLRTGHGEKKINLNQFYQEYIANKEHVHMNATKWASLTEFAKYLGRAGICRVDEDEKNVERGGASSLMIAWIDNSPEAMRRSEALRKKEKQDRGDEEREQRMIEAQIRKARRQGMEDDDDDEEEIQETTDENAVDWQNRNDGEKVVLNFGAKRNQDAEKSQPPTPPLTDKDSASEKEASAERDSTSPPSEVQHPLSMSKPEAMQQDSNAAKPVTSTTTKPISLSLASSKPKNVFAAASKKNAPGGAKKPSSLAQQRPISEAERIMKEEIERKRQREAHGGNVFKKQRVG